MTQGNKQRRSIEQRLGAALFDAVGLLVRQYFDGGEESVETLGAERNESFDESRFFALAGEERSEWETPFSFEEERLFGGTPRESERLSLPRRGGESAAMFPRAAEDVPTAPMSARELSEQFERSARRYNGAFES